MRQGRSRSSAAGTTLVEVAVAAAIVVSGLLAVVLSLFASAGQASAERERSRAVEAARSALERARGLPFEDAFALLNDDAADDPDGTGTAPGAAFAVDGLSAPGGDADGLPGRFLLPVNQSTGALSETPNNQFQGLGRDLNGNGDATDADVSTTYTLLPITALVEWQSVNGRLCVEVTTILRPSP